MHAIDHSMTCAVPCRWLSVGLVTWWLWVRFLVEANFLSEVFLPRTSAGACEKSSQCLWKEKLCLYWCEKARKHMCVADCHDMTLAVKVTLNPNTTNQPWLVHVTLSQTSPSFYVSAVQVLRKHCGEKEKLLETSNFSHSPVFSTCLGNLCHFHQIQNCCLQTFQFGSVENLSFGEGWISYYLRYKCSAFNLCS